MKLATLAILRCPYCGNPLRLADSPFLEIRGDDVETGRLECACNAYPIIAGIPDFATGDYALELLAEGRVEEALFAELELEGESAQRFRELTAGPEPPTLRQAVEILHPHPEGRYFLYRFSDPTFRTTRYLLASLTRDQRLVRGRILDVAGGAGHLTCALAEVSSPEQVVLADSIFWKLWLGKRYLSPGSEVVCSTAEVPLPFARDAFSLAVCSDAFHYIWQKRLLATEMLRVVGDTGLVALPHLHNRQCENPSPGMPLNPEEYRPMLEGFDTRVFGEGALFEALLADEGIDLTREPTPDELAREPALVVLATRLAGVFRRFEPPQEAVPGALEMNPLYQPSGDGGWTLTFPSPEYEAEYARCRRYLPERVEIDGETLAAARSGARTARIERWARQCVLLPLPERYL